MRSSTASVVASAAVVSGWSARHCTIRRAARWKVSFGAKPGTKRRILVRSKTALWPMSPSTSPDQNQSGATTGKSSEATCTSFASTPRASATMA